VYSSAPPHAVPRVRLGMVGADAGHVKGILKPSRAWARAAGDDASDEDARRRALAAGKAPEQPSRRDEDTATTATYERFHDRVGAVFANLGPGLTTPGVSNAARPDPPAWMPANTSVFRRGRDVPDRDDDDDDDDDDSEPDPDDDALEPAHRDPSDGAGPSDDPRRWDDDLDCLRSDDDDDEGGGGVDDDGAGANPSDVGAKDAHLRRSVGRCVALNREDEYDAYDAVAMTGGRVDITTVAADGRVGGRLEAFANAPDDEEAALRPDSVVVERDDSDDDDDDDRGETDGARAERSGGTRRARETLAPYVPPAKRAKRGVTWAPASAGVSAGGSDPATTRASAPASAPRRRARGHRVGNSWVPDHVKHPERYTCYTLDEPLIIGGGLSGNGSRANGSRGGAGDSVAVRATASRPPRDAAATASPSTDRAEGERQKQTPIVFRPSAAAAAKRRRSGAVDAAAAATAAAGCVSFARRADEDDDGAGGGEEELVVGAVGGGRARGGSARGNQRRFRRKAASEDEDE
jgi:hypothetical protein